MPLLIKYVWMDIDYNDCIAVDEHGFKIQGTGWGVKKNYDW